MASSTPNIILLQVNGAERPIFERLAGGTVTPGDHLTLGTNGRVTALAGAGAVSRKMFALENPFAPNPAQTALAQTYAEHDNVRYVYAQPGDLVYARLAASQTIDVGDILVASATGGCLAKVTIDATVLTGAVVGVAEEAVTTTGSTGRIKIRVL